MIILPHPGSIPPSICYIVMHPAVGEQALQELREHYPQHTIILCDDRMKDSEGTVLFANKKNVTICDHCIVLDPNSPAIDIS